MHWFWLFADADRVESDSGSEEQHLKEEDVDETIIPLMFFVSLRDWITLFCSIFTTERIQVLAQPWYYLSKSECIMVFAKCWIEYASAPWRWVYRDVYNSTHKSSSDIFLVFTRTWATPVASCWSPWRCNTRSSPCISNTSTASFRFTSWIYRTTFTRRNFQRTPYTVINQPLRSNNLLNCLELEQVPKPIQTIRRFQH